MKVETTSEQANQPQECAAAEDIVAMAATRVVMHQIVLPSEVDALGICFGGQVRAVLQAASSLITALPPRVAQSQFHCQHLNSRSSAFICICAPCCRCLMWSQWPQTVHGCSGGCSGVCCMRHICPLMMTSRWPSHTWMKFEMIYCGQHLNALCLVRPEHCTICCSSV